MMGKNNQKTIGQISLLSDELSVKRHIKSQRLTHLICALNKWDLQGSTSPLYFLKLIVCSTTLYQIMIYIASRFHHVKVINTETQFPYIRGTYLIFTIRFYKFPLHHLCRILKGNKTDILLSFKVDGLLSV